MWQQTGRTERKSLTTDVWWAVDSSVGASQHDPQPANCIATFAVPSCVRQPTAQTDTPPLDTVASSRHCPLTS